MSNMHRILWFDERVRAGAFPNARELAERFEISIRQAGRDVEYMQSSLLAPLTYNAKRRGYEYEDAAYRLPSVFLTETDIRILNYLIYKYEEAARSMGYLEGLDRVVQTLKRFVPYQPEESDFPIFFVDAGLANRKHELDRAIADGEKLRVTYADGEDTYTVTIHPYQAYARPNGVQVIAFCEQSGEVEYYRLERFSKVVRTGEAYRRDDP
ncbi:helix-turn-helix transcriptional regulator [Paenibacillus sp.]|uniref:helix-turn-helix transcriptional regulator n=1 Tax=Paenibacillus sp. TaxID=58172 RepID=UPI002D4EDC66|nr:WYL domain-containing protein [Paenibacillus sp.]HZG57209.1 WYL domain-containing protein [Paenibacillus sp.]